MQTQRTTVVVFGFANPKIKKLEVMMSKRQLRGCLRSNAKMQKGQTSSQFAQK